MTNIDEYITQFHNIKYGTKRETIERFNEFIKSLEENLNGNEINNFVKLLSPKTALEETYRLDIILKLKRKDILFQELKTCNPLFVRKLLKNWSLFTELFSNLTSNDLINDIFPYLSYSLKLKILNGINKHVKNESLLNKYFIELEKKYGLKVATVILSGCSIDLIRNIIEKYQLELTNVNLKRIFKKDKDFIEFYFDVLLKKSKNIALSYQYAYIFKYVAKIEPKIYWKLNDKLKLDVNFGKHMTPNMCKSNENILTENSNILYKLNRLKLYKTLQKEGKLNAFLYNIYPETHNQFTDICINGVFFDFIKSGPKNTWYKITSDVFKEKYGKNLLDFPDYFEECLLKVTPLKEREEILNLKIKDNKNLYYLYETKTSIPALKEQLKNASDNATRVELIKQLSETCRVNNEPDLLLEVMEYVFNRSRNDTYPLYVFLNSVLEWPNVTDLPEKHWKCIAEIGKYLEITKMRLSNFYESYLLYLLKNNKSIDNLLKTIIDLVIEQKTNCFPDIEDKKYQAIYFNRMKHCLDLYQDHHKYETTVLDFIAGKAYKYPKEILHHFGDKFHLKDIDTYIGHLVKYWYKYDNDMVHDIFWRQNAFYNCEHIKWYIQNRPDVLKINIDNMIRKLDMHHQYKTFRDLKKYLNSDLNEEIKKCTLKNLESDNVTTVSRSLKIIILWYPDLFIEIIKSLLPTPTKQTQLTEEENKLINITPKIGMKKLIIQNLHRIQYRKEAFPLILTYCKGNYIKSAQKSIQSLAYNTPEIHINEFLNKLSNKPICIRNYIIKLGKFLLPSDDFYKILQEWYENETKLSIRTILLKNTIQYFIKNPSERYWIIFQSILNKIDTSDAELYNFMINFYVKKQRHLWTQKINKKNSIPKDYFPKYIEIVYKKMSENTNIEISNKKFELIDNIPSEIFDKLDIVFIKEVIADTICGKNQSDFHWKCLFYVNEDKQLEILDENFKVLKEFINKNDFGLKQKHNKLKIINFLLQFYRLANELKPNINLIETFMKFWTLLFKSEKFNEEYMLIEFTHEYFQSNFDNHQTGQKINNLLYDYIDKYTSNIIHSFCEQLHSFLKTAHIEDDALYKFLNGFFQNKKDENIYVALMYFLPREIPAEDNRSRNYISMLEMIKNCKIPLVQYYFDPYLTDNGLEVNF